MLFHISFFLFAFGTVTDQSGKLDLAQADGFGSDFDLLIILDEVQGVFQSHGLDRGEDNGLVLTGCAHVGQFLFLGTVDVDIIVTVVFADDHPS